MCNHSLESIVGSAVDLDMNDQQRLLSMVCAMLLHNHDVCISNFAIDFIMMGVIAYITDEADPGDYLALRDNPIENAGDFAKRYRMGMSLAHQGALLAEKVMRIYYEHV